MAQRCTLVRLLVIVQTSQNNHVDILAKPRRVLLALCLQGNAFHDILKSERQHSYIVYFPAVVPAQSVIQVQRVRTVQDCGKNSSSPEWLRPKLCMKL